MDPWKPGKALTFRLLGCPAFAPGFPLCGHSPHPVLPVASCNQSKFDCGKSDPFAKQLEFVLSPTEVGKSSCFRRPLLAAFVLLTTEIRAFADPTSCFYRPINIPAGPDSEWLGTVLGG